MSERARLWQRVSTGGQDEENQLPDLIRWCKSHRYEYDLDDRYVLHGKSASKGKHQKWIDRAVEDMAEGKYTVLVVWQSSRIERRGAWNAFDLARRVKDAGGRIEYVKDAYLNDANDMSDVMLALAATKDRQKSEDISKTVKASHAARRAKGSIVGRAPWGYRIERQGDIKVIVPTAEGRRYIPQIFQRVIDGESLRKIAAWLDSEGASTESGKRWNESYLGNRLIKNTTYMGQRPNAGELKTEALVSPTAWQQANEALRSRYRPGRGTVKRPKALLAPVCGACYGKPREGCPSGISPMYPITARGGKVYYRCTGHGPQRKGCGAPMVDCAELDKLVMFRLLHPAAHVMHSERVFIPGDDRADDIARLRERGAEAMRRGDYDAATAAMREASDLEKLPAIRPHWERRQTSETEAHYVARLTDDQRREYLAGYEVKAWRGDGEVKTALKAL